MKLYVSHKDVNNLAIAIAGYYAYTKNERMMFLLRDILIADATQKSGTYITRETYDEIQELLAKENLPLL